MVPGKKAKTKIQNLSQKKTENYSEPISNGTAPCFWCQRGMARSVSSKKVLIDWSYIVVLLWTFGHYMVLLPCVFFVIPADPRRHIEARSLSPVRGIAFPPAFQASGVDSDGFFCGSMVAKILYPPVIKGDNSSNRLYINCVLMGKSHTSIYIYIYMICMSDFLYAMFDYQRESRSIDIINGGGRWNVDNS